MTLDPDAEDMEMIAEELDPAIQLERLRDVRAARVTRLGETTFRMVRDEDVDYPQILHMVEEIRALDERVRPIEESLILTGRSGEPSRLPRTASLRCHCGGVTRAREVFCRLCRDILVDVEHLNGAAPPQIEKCVCGESILPGTRFCPNCGKPPSGMSSNPGQLAADRACSKCGRIMAPRARFCTACGMQVRHCRNCGARNSLLSKVCLNCMEPMPTRARSAPASPE